MKISAVIVTHNSAACIENCIASVRAALPVAELVIVDNDSRDDTIPRARTTSPGARVVRMDTNIGFGRACNAGAIAASGSHILFLNPDAVVTRVDGNALASLLSERPFGLVAPDLEGEGTRYRAEKAWPVEYFAHTFQALRPNEWRPRRSRPEGTDDDWVSGAMLLVARDEFLDLGGFDSRFFLYYEDRDLSRRYRDNHLPVRETSAICGRHMVGSSSAHDGLRAGPAAWSLLGWLQYVATYEGERSARYAACATMATLRLLRGALQVLSVMRLPRTRRKALQLDELLRFIRDRETASDATTCPDAIRALRGRV